MDKLKQKSAQVHLPHKTKDDFLRWLRKKEALDKETADKKTAPAAKEMRRELMVWDDDGG